MVPRRPAGLTTTCTPFGTVEPKIPWTKVFVWTPLLPTRIVFASPAAPSAPIAMLLLPVVRESPAFGPSAMLLSPLVLLESALEPMPVLPIPVVLWASALNPLAVFRMPLVC